MKLLATVLLILATPMLWVPTPGHALPSESSQAVQSEKVPTLQELEQGIAGRLKRVEEFRFIEQEAAKLGVRAWLFGGTAAGYAHYVKWDMQREKGDPRFQKDRFDYDYTNIYRSTQDLDIVIDGNPEQAQKLQALLQEKYPHLQGSKTAWEVRLLTQDIGDKQAILNNPDFMNQHTDSNSTGLIELTKPRAGEDVIRDVRDWKSKEPYFLKDVHDAMLHYYYSPLHGTTKFAREGRNPPIFSAIRFLTKAFQYELKVRPQDLEQIKKVIDEFNPKQIPKEGFVADWIEKNGKKLIQNAVNIEYAWNTLERLGLRRKLQGIKGDVHATESLAWWMNKEPLRTEVLGRGTGKTARELGLDIVAHETRSFLAYESITRAHTGDSNVLISRDGVSGEEAAHGHGFYVKSGREGARHTGFTIRLHLDPNAREGTDFEYIRGEDYVVVKNKAALKVIPESLSIGPVEFFQMLAAQETENKAGFAASDRGIIEKLKRRIGAKVHALSQSDREKIIAILKEEIPKSGKFDATLAVRVWFSFPIAAQYPELVEALLKLDNRHINVWLQRFVLSQPHWQTHPELIELLFKKGTEDQMICETLAKPHWKSHPEWIDLLIERGKADVQVAYLLAYPHWQNDPNWTGWVEKLLNKGNVDIDTVITQTILSSPLPPGHPASQKQIQWIEEMIKKGEVDRHIAGFVLSDPGWKSHPEWMEALVKRCSNDMTLARYALSKPHWQNHPKWAEWVGRLLAKRDFQVDIGIAIGILMDPVSKNHPEWLEDLIKRGYRAGTNEWVHILEKVDSALAQPHWKNHPKLRAMVGGKDPTFFGLSKYYENGGASLRAPAGSCIPRQLDRLLRVMSGK
jgi:hypothetical protein